MTGMWRILGVVLLIVALAVAGCASPAAPSAPGGMVAAPAPAQPTTLVMVVNSEVSNLATKATGPQSPTRTTRLFNAGLTILDTQDNPQPYLAEALPQLNTDTWQVFPDGHVESTWKLRPGLTWHDGQPLTAEDFVFAFRVYSAPELSGIFGPRPQNLVERIAAIDARTVRIFWRSPFLHQGEGLEPLPRHILAEPFAAFEQDPASQRDAFMSVRFWKAEYVGAGPFKLTNWEPASHLEGAAFDGHALGRPKIDRLVLRFIVDENTAFANLIGGSAHYVMTNTIGWEHAVILRRQRGFNDAEGKGKLLYTVDSTTTAVPQHRPEYQQTPGLLDLRVRRAIAHAIDKDAINEGIFDSQAPVPDTFIGREASYYAEVDRAITKYPYDPRRTEQLMREAGYARGGDGVFVSPNGQRFQPALWGSAGAQRERLLTILLNSWQGAGIDAELYILPAALERDQHARATFPGILVHGIGGSGETGGGAGLASEQIGTPANRWNGSNRGGWSNLTHDLLWERYNTTLDRAEQIQTVVQMMKVHSELIPTFPLSSFVQAIAHLSVLKGPDGHSTHWDIHLWEVKSAE